MSCKHGVPGTADSNVRLPQPGASQRAPGQPVVRTRAADSGLDRLRYVMFLWSRSSAFSLSCSLARDCPLGSQRLWSAPIPHLLPPHRFLHGPPEPPTENLRPRAPDPGCLLGDACSEHAAASRFCRANNMPYLSLGCTVVPLRAILVGLWARAPRRRCVSTTILIPKVGYTAYKSRSIGRQLSSDGIRLLS